MKKCKRIVSAVTALSAAVSVLIPLSAVPMQSVSAVSTDYPPQLMHIAAKDNSSVLSETAASDGAALKMSGLGGTFSGTWRFDRVGTDSNGTFFKITNAESGRLITPDNYRVTAGNNVILYGSESHKTQHWYVIPVQKDSLGNGLYYKIVNYADTSLALTQTAGGMTLSSYSGADNQLWLLNCDGLQGFAGYCENDNTGKVKAADIGGLFGELVEVNNFKDLQKYASDDKPYTIVVSADMKVSSLQKDSSGRYYCPDGRIYVHNNKTIIGSYNAHTLYNVQFCTASGKGTGDNIIIKNFDLQHDKESNGNDSIVVYFGSGKNLWVDHCTFTGHADYNKASTGLPDYDKFFACCYDADYCTVSNSSFGLHEYGLILGYPDDKESDYQTYNNYPRMSIMGNQFDKTLTRAPGLMRYGYFHSMNNYVNQFSMAYTVHSACKIHAENCVYENGGNVICDWNSISHAGAYSESGSIFSKCSRTVQGQGTQNNPSLSVANTWRPSSNYKYAILSANETKGYCTTYSGCQNDRSKMNYIGYRSAGIPSAGFTESPSASFGPSAASFQEGASFRFRNAKSGLYMQVEDAAAKNNANIQQWGSDAESAHDIWKMYSAGEGYYYIISCVGDGASYALDVEGKKTADGTNMDLYQWNGGSQQQYMLTENEDGSYKILTKISSGKSAVEVQDASLSSGANIQQWSVNGSDCQNWFLEEAIDPGCSMDTSLAYTFENANSGYVMDIENADMKNHTNVRQWESNGLNCQKWYLEQVGNANDYRIISLEDSSYMLNITKNENGGNLEIADAGNTVCDTFRFSKKPDGTYVIYNVDSQMTEYVEVDAASTKMGANIQQWTMTGSTCQNWKLLTEKLPEMPAAGDINLDGVCSAADAVLLQKWLCGIPETELPNPKAADLNDDQKITAADLTLLKRIVFYN
ncbi:MAG: RICIN domain-containing protein [Oscillospiraceae bacterium]|nr:RICIN domain-containing protein [Oscillospiraceae bacterium]